MINLMYLVGVYTKADLCQPILMKVTVDGDSLDFHFRRYHHKTPKMVVYVNGDVACPIEDPDNLNRLRSDEDGVYFVDEIPDF